MEEERKRKREERPCIRVSVNQVNVVRPYDEEALEVDRWTREFVLPGWVWPGEY
jgi:hypothetical protein